MLCTPERERGMYEQSFDVMDDKCHVVYLYVKHLPPFTSLRITCVCVCDIVSRGHLPFNCSHDERVGKLKVFNSALDTYDFSYFKIKTIILKSCNVAMFHFNVSQCFIHLNFLFSCFFSPIFTFSCCKLDFKWNWKKYFLHRATGVQLFIH